jgi:hypothetical protein
VSVWWRFGPRSWGCILVATSVLVRRVLSALFSVLLLTSVGGEGWAACFIDIDDDADLDTGAAAALIGPQIVHSLTATRDCPRPG